MARRMERQLTLELKYEEKLQLPDRKAPELVLALAELLLEALKGEEEAQTKGGHDESEDHA